MSLISIRQPYRPIFQTSATRRSVNKATVGASSTGSDAIDDLSDASSVDDVDRVFRKYTKAGNVPGYIASDWWVPIALTGGGHKLELLVAPDYFAIGTNSDPLRAGKISQFMAQEIADRYDSILPSQKLLAAIEANAANPKIPFIAVQTASGGADDSVSAMIKANAKAQSALDAAGFTPRDGKIKIGYSKAYVTRPGLNGDYLAIYGGRWSAAGGLVQPTSGHAHTTGQIPGTPNYSDYSHRVVLVSRKAKLDGEWVDLREDVFGSKDPSVWSLVSGEGRFDPVFPNTGSGSVATFSVGPGESGVSGGGGLSGGGAASTAAVGNGWGRALAVAGAVMVAGVVAWAVA